MVATAGSVSNIRYISWKSVQVFLLCVESELEKLPLAKDLQTVLEFPLLTSQERATADSKSGATHYLSLLSARSAEKEVSREGGHQSPIFLLSRIWPTNDTKEDSRKEMGRGIH